MEIYKLRREVVGGFNGRVKSRLAYRRFTWHGFENASIFVSLVLMVAYAVFIDTYCIGMQKLKQSVACFT